MTFRWQKFSKVLQPYAALLAAAAVICGGCGDKAATEDNQTNRLKAAETYLNVSPPEEILNEALNRVSIGYSQRAKDALFVTAEKELRKEVLRKTCLDALVEHFTVGELEAMTKFYSSEEGRSIKKKMIIYTEVLLPLIQGELSRIVELNYPSVSGLRWERKSMRLSPSLNNEELSVRFTFSNISDKNITIDAIQVSAPNAQASINKMTFQPGDAGVLDVSYEPGDRVGEQLVGVTLITDDENKPVHTCWLDIEIPEYISMEPPFVYWMQGERPEPVLVNIENNEDHDVRIISMESSHANVQARFVSAGGTGQHQMHLNVSDTSQPLDAVVTLKALIEPEHEKEYTLYVRVVPRNL